MDVKDMNQDEVAAGARWAKALYEKIMGAGS